MDNIWIIGIHTITDVKNLIPMVLQILDTSSRHQKNHQGSKVPKVDAKKHAE